MAMFDVLFDMQPQFRREVVVEIVGELSTHRIAIDFNQSYF